MVPEVLGELETTALIESLEKSCGTATMHVNSASTACLSITDGGNGADFLQLAFLR